MVTTDLCRDIAMEAVRRGARANVHELWALLEHLEGVRPDLIVDVGSGPAEWWAWWSLCPNVIGASMEASATQSAFSGPHLPAGVTALEGDPVDVTTALRVVDQIARRPVDVLVIGADANLRWLYGTYAKHVRPGGLVVLHGIADAARPNIGAFWRDLVAGDQQELIGAEHPDGYGILTIPRKVNSNG